MEPDQSFVDTHTENLSGANAFFEKHLLSTLDEGTYFTLNPQSISSLDILPRLKPDGTPESSNNGPATSRSDTTIYSVLNKCRTTSGQRLLAIWLKHPLTSKRKIDTRLDIVQHLMENGQLRSICYDDYLRKLPDLLRVSYKISAEKCNLTDLMKVYNSCQSVRGLNKSFHKILSISNIEAPEAVKKLFQWVEKACIDLNDFSNLIDDSIDVNSLDESGDYMVKPGHDEDLAKLSLEITSLASRARKELSYSAEELSLEIDKSIKLETDSEKGFGLRVTKQNEQLVRGRREYEQLSLVKKDGYRFTNKALTKLSSRYVDAKEEYNRLAKRIIEHLVNEAVMHHESVLEFSLALTFIDVFVALSIAAVQNNYVRPLILDADAEKIDIEKLRHPCVENQPDIDNYVPNDIVMSKDEKKCLIITGPNMGGKSTFIKSVAVVVIMAQCGSLIPAEDARISIVDNIFTRIGSGDRQAEGKSAFMEEMLDMKVTLDKATNNSLLIIDELGRGTSTFDGFGLSWAICKHLAVNVRSFILFATHFHELTEMEEELDCVGNLHVKAICQADKLTMLYNVDKGVCDESYGINVARYCNFPDHVIKLAEEKLREFEEVPGFSSKKEAREYAKKLIRGGNLATPN